MMNSRTSDCMLEPVGAVTGAGSCRPPNISRSIRLAAVAATVYTTIYAGTCVRAWIIYTNQAIVTNMAPFMSFRVILVIE